VSTVLATNCFRERCTNAQLTVWLANRRLTLTAQLQLDVALQEAQLTNYMVNCTSSVDLCEPSLFKLNALALSVIATATWLAGWLSVTAGIVSKRLNLSENFLDHLV